MFIYLRQWSGVYGRERCYRSAFDGLDSARFCGRDRWQSPTSATRVFVEPYLGSSMRGVRYSRGRFKVLWSRVVHILDSGELVRVVGSRTTLSLGRPIANGAVARRRIVWSRPDFESETGGRVPPLVFLLRQISDRVCELCGIYQGSI